MDLFKFFNRKNVKSKDIAKERLQFVLVHDRVKCSPELIERIKEDIMKVISKYIEIEEDGLEIDLSKTESDGNNGMVPVLFANIPIKKIRKLEK